VKDVWESDDAFRRFGEILMPIMSDLGVHEEPKVYPLHTLVSG